MVNPKVVLGLYDYCNYRSVRGVAWRFMLLGSVLLVSGIICTFLTNGRPRQQIHPAVAFGMAFVGLVGVIGGIVVLRGNRRWTSAMKAMAYCYIIVFPFGPVFSYFLLSDLPRYLRSMDEIRARREA